MKHKLSKVIFISVSIFLFSFSFFGAPIVSSASKVGSSLGVFIPRAPGPDIGFYTCSATSPCPMGVADYGVNGASSYSYQASKFESWANFTTLSIGESPNGCIGSQSDCMTIQQNLVAYNVFEQGRNAPSAASPDKKAKFSGEYWPQDVPFVAQSGSEFYVNELDNIWNFSSPTAEMNGGISADLLGQCAQHGGEPEYYYCLGDATIATTLPMEIEMVLTTGVMTSGTYTGHSYFEFGIWVYHSNTLVGGGWFDEVAFSAKVSATKASKAPYFFVSGSQKNPLGLYNDAETVLCGPGGGSTVSINSVSGNVTEAYIPLSGGSLTPVPHAWSAGTDTAETVSHVKMISTVAGVGESTSGTDNNNQLW
jgi:Thermopsin